MHSDSSNTPESSGDPDLDEWWSSHPHGYAAGREAFLEHLKASVLHDMATPSGRARLRRAGFDFPEPSSKHKRSKKQ